MGLNILIAMQHGVLQIGLQAIFSEEPQVSNVYVVGSEKDLQVALLRNRLDLIIVDQSLSTDFTMLQGTNFAILVAKQDKPDIAYEQGACGYFSSNASAEFLYTLLFSEAQSFLLDPTIGAWLMYDVVGRSPLPISNRSLTSREREIIGLLCQLPSILDQRFTLWTPPQFRISLQACNFGFTVRGIRDH